MSDGFKKSLEELAARIQVDDTIVDDESLEHCPTCNGLGMVRPDVPEHHRLYGKLISCFDCEKGQAEYSRILKNRIKETELPKIYRNASLYDWKSEITSTKGKLLAYLTAVEFVESPDNTISSHAVAKRVEHLMQSNTPDWIYAILESNDIIRNGFVFYGSVGTGKTWLAAAVMNALVDQDKIVLYMRAQDIIQSLTATWSNRENSEDTVLERYKQTPFLFIDDMNLELRGDALLPHQKGYMEAIIRHRSNHDLRTFITCNIAPEQFYEQWGDRIGDVIAADSQWVKIGGAKLRQTQQGWETL